MLNLPSFQFHGNKVLFFLEDGAHHFLIQSNAFVNIELETAEQDSDQTVRQLSALV